MKKIKFILGVAAALFAAFSLGSCNMENTNSDVSTKVSKALSSLTVYATFSTLTYETGETLKTNGVMVYAVYNDDTTADVTSKATFSPANGDTLTFSGTVNAVSETQTVTVSYTEDSVTKSTTYDITVKDKVTDVALTSGYSVYSYGSSTKTLYSSEATLTITYRNGSTETVNASEGTWGPVYNSSSDGDSVVTVTYGNFVSEPITVDSSASVSELYKVGVSVSDLLNAGVRVSDLLSAGVSVSDLKAADSTITIGELVENGATVSSIVEYSSSVTSEYSSGTKDGTGSTWASGSNYTVPAAGESQTVYFVNYGLGDSNYNNFYLETYGNNSSGITMRADNWAWNYAGGGTVGTEISVGSTEGGDEDGETFKKSTTNGDDDWASWLTAIKDGELCKVVVSRDDSNWVTFTVTSPDSALSSWTQTYKIKLITETAQSDTFYWHFTNGDNECYVIVLGE